ncbi:MULTISPECIES: amidohydrolase family protein [Streptomyces]|uniref:Hydrolase n=1 Tax=Streptomyces globisporus TaxID=1908 RepID=A0A423V2B7_STRGL|nr:MULTISPECIES: amidohydrolase family protein [Streptomyces]ROV68755.1 hydrolase [Streptomyces globisporus]
MERQPVFDFHARLTGAPGALDRLLSAMDRSGVERAGVAAGGVVDLDVLARQLVEGGHVTSDPDNGIVLDAARGSAGRLTAFWFGNPHQGTADYGAHGAECAALELSPAVHGVSLDDPRTTAFLDLAEEFGHPVYVVCIDRDGCRVSDLAVQAAKRPQTVFVLGHLGIGLIDTYAIDIVRPVPNVVVETSGGFGFTVRVAIERLGAERVLFAAEHPLQDPAVELAKYQALGLPHAVLQQVLWQNAHRILRLESP